MIRIIFLLLIVMSAAAFAQTEEQPKAVLIDEFETATNGYVKMKMDYFYNELNNNPSAQGVIINYGTAREIAIREKQIRVSIQWRKYDAARITMVNGGFNVEVKSEFWIVPAGAENPMPVLKAEKFDEFGQISDGDLKARLQNLYVNLSNSPNSRAYIVNYGSAKTIAIQEARFKRIIGINYLNLNLNLVTFKKGVYEKKIRTEIWLISKK